MCVRLAVSLDSVAFSCCARYKLITKSPKIKIKTKIVIRAELRSAGLYEKALAARPSEAKLSMWDPKSPGFGAGTHGMNAAMIPGGKYAPGATAGTEQLQSAHNVLI